MSNTKTIHNQATNTGLYKLQDNSSGFISNSFPIRRLARSSFDSKFVFFFYNVSNFQFFIKYSF